MIDNGRVSCFEGARKGCFTSREENRRGLEAAGRVAAQAQQPPEIARKGTQLGILEVPCGSKGMQAGCGCGKELWRRCASLVLANAEGLAQPEKADVLNTKLIA